MQDHLSSALRDKIEILTLIQDDETGNMAWAPSRKRWGSVEIDRQRNLFSIAGVGSQGATIIIRPDPLLTLHQAIRWNGEFLHLTSILTYINETYGGLSDKLATSYDALTDNLSDVQADIDSAMGEGYNEERSKSIAAQIESYGGELGDALQEANKAIGAGRAALQNLADQYTEEALSAVLTGKETALDWSDGNAERLQELAGLYQQAMEDYNNGNTQAGTLVETYLEEARALAEAQYDSSEAVRAQTDAENDMITAIRENTAALGGWKAQYDLSQNLTKGRAATWTATTQTTGTSSGTNTMIANGYGYANVVPRNAIGYAVGIDYVPYDNFPALLHQGEQVLTAEEARSGNGGSGGVQIIMNGVTIREDADIDRVAAALLQKMELAGMRG